MTKDKDYTKVHYLSTQSIVVPSLELLKSRQRIKELEMQLESDIKFFDEISEKGLMDTYMKLKYGK